MTVDAGRAAFEELKRLSATLVEFVAADQGIPPEIVFKVLLSLGKAVRLSAGRRRRPFVSKSLRASDGSRGARAIRGSRRRGRGRSRRVWRAQRAALRQMVFTLEPVIAPDNLAGLVMKSSRLLDEGDARAGMFTPVKRGRGRPGHSVNDDNERLMIEVVYTQTLKNVSRDEAVTLVYAARSGRTQRRQVHNCPSRRCCGAATTKRFAAS